MPIVSEHQRKAMYAALNGNSTLGIPKKVAEEYISKDETPPWLQDLFRYMAIDEVVFDEEQDEEYRKWMAGDNDLPAKDSSVEYHGREGRRIGGQYKMVHVISIDGKSYEIQDATKEGAIKKAKAQAGIAQDCLLAMDRAPSDVKLRGRDGLAFDFKTSRTYTPEGHLHVEQSNISKANVSPYRGKEIPNWQGLGLDPEKVYQLLRDPKELEKAASTFNNKPILSRHVPVDADDHDPDLVNGSVSNVSYEHPFLKGDLGIWRRDAIDDVENKTKQQLSSAYRYRADMTPGVYQGAPYHGVMRDIVGNHVAQVKDGRAGDDVVVGDENINQENIMTKQVLSRTAVAVQGALAVYLLPKLAMDAKPVDLAGMLTTVTAKNYVKSKPSIIKALVKATKDKLAQDADLEDLGKALDALKPEDIKEGNDLDPSSGLPKVENEDDDVMDDVNADAEPMAKVMQFLKGKVSDEDMAEISKMCAPAGDEDPEKKPVLDADMTPEEKAAAEKKAAADKAAKDKDMAKDKDDEKVSKKEMEGAMDAALKKNSSEVEKKVVKRMQDTAAAIKKVHPLIGDVNLAFDSAEGVFRHALIADGVDEEALVDIGASSLPLLIDQRIALKTQAGKGRVKVGDGLAMDAKSVGGFSKRYPNAAKIEVGAI